MRICGKKTAKLEGQVVQPERMKRHNIKIRTKQNWLSWVVSLGLHAALALGLLLVVQALPQTDETPAATPKTVFASASEKAPQLKPLSLEPQTTAPSLSPMKPQPPRSVPDIAPPALREEIPSSSLPVSAGIAAGQDSRPTIAWATTGRESRFCGATGQAQRVCFVVDHSGSMVVGFDYIKRQLAQTIERLTPGQSFHIVFFAGDEPRELPGGALRRARRQERNTAVQFVQQMQLAAVAGRGRAWQAVVDALQRALTVSNAAGQNAELIYLFTDGDYDHEQVLRAVQGMQQQRRQPAVINVLACGSRQGELFLQALAERYRGQYRFLTDEEMTQ